jgi:hypothetical protein
VPGFEEKELSVEVTDHTLVVEGEQLETREEKDKQYRLHERLEKSFERRFTLPLERIRRRSAPSSPRACSRFTHRRWMSRSRGRSRSRPGK